MGAALGHTTYYEKYYQALQGREKEMSVGCSCLLWKLKCSHRLPEVLVPGWVGHGGALQLATCGLCSKGFTSTDGKGSASPGGSRFFCFCYIVRGQRLLLKSACWCQAVFDWEFSNIHLSTYTSVSGSKKNVGFLKELPNTAGTKGAWFFRRCLSLLALLLHQSWMALQAAPQSLALCSQQQVLVKRLTLSLTILGGYRSADKAGYCLPCI